MKAEKYIKTMVSLYDGKLCDWQAKQAIYIARREEREKSVEAFKKVISECGSKCERTCSYFCNDECLIEKFEELLNE